MSYLRKKYIQDSSDSEESDPDTVVTADEHFPVFIQ